MRNQCRLILFGWICIASGWAGVNTLGVAKNAEIQGRQVQLDFYLENFDVGTLTGLSLTDDLNATFGAGTFSIASAPSFVQNPGTITLNAGFNGAADTQLISSGTLAGLQTAQIRVVVELDDLSGGPIFYNTASCFSNESGTDDSVDGTNPDPNGDNDPIESGPTPIDFGADPRIGIAKSATLSGSQVTFDYFIENLGNRDLNNLTLPDDLDAVFGAGNYAVISTPSLVNGPMGISPNGSFDGSSDLNILGISSLAIGTSAQIQLVVNVTNVTDQGMGLGVYSNQVLISGTSVPTPFMEDPVNQKAQTSDLSDNGFDPDPNGNGLAGDPGEDDPTVFTIGEEPAIGLAKFATVFSDSTVTFDFYLENLGNTNLTQIDLIDDLSTTFGTDTFALVAPPQLIAGSVVINPSYDGLGDTHLLDPSTLSLGQTAQVQVTVKVTSISDQGLGVGNYFNNAQIVAQAPAGGLCFDFSDDGTDPDPDGDSVANELGENDPTAFTIAEYPLIGISKSVTVVGTTTKGVRRNCANSTNTGILITFNYLIQNFGNVTLFNLSAPDDLDLVFGAGNFGVGSQFLLSSPATVSLNSGFNGSCNQEMIGAGSSLPPGEIVEFQVEVMAITLTDQGLGLGNYSNQVSAVAQSPSLSPVSDLSHSGNNPDPNDNGDPTEAGENDPTLFSLGSNIGVAKTANVVGNQVTFDLYLESFSSLSLNLVSLSDDLDGVFGAGNYFISTPPFLVDDPGTLTLNPSFDGTSDMELLAPGSSLGGMDTAQIQMTVTVQTLTPGPSFQLGVYQNQALIEYLTPSGNPVFDLSDAGTDPDPDGDGNPNETNENDPTSFTVTFNSVVGAALTATSNGFDATLTFYLENLGPGTHQNLSLLMNLDAIFGAGKYTVNSRNLTTDPGTLMLNPSFNGASQTDLLVPGSSSLNNGAIAVLVVDLSVMNLTYPLGNGNGLYSLQAQVTGMDSNGLGTSDFSDSGSDPDPNGNGDPTNANENDPTLLALGKTHLGIAVNTVVQGTQITYDVLFDNLSDYTISGIAMSASLLSTFGFGNFNISSTTVLEGANNIGLNTSYDGLFSPNLVFNGVLNKGEFTKVRIVVNVTNVTNQGNGFGVYITSFTADGTLPNGLTTPDTSDAGVLSDPNFNGNPNEAGENDSNRVVIGEEPTFGVAKTTMVSGNQVTFDLYLENLGNATLSNVSVIDRLSDVFGAGNYTVTTPPFFTNDPGSLVLNPAFDGSSDSELIQSGTFSAGATAAIQLVVDVTNLADVGFGFGNYQNQAIAYANGPTATLGADLSDVGSDPDPNGNGNPCDAGESDPATFSIMGTEALGIAKRAQVSGRQVTFDFFIENLGTQTLNNIQVDEDLNALFGAGNWVLTQGPTLIGSPRSLAVNTSFNGTGDTALVSGSIDAGIFEQVQIIVTVNNLVDQGSGLGVYSNQVTVSGELGMSVLTDLSDSGTDPDPNGNGDPTDAGEDDPTVFVMPQLPVIGVAKTASVSGRTVTLNFYLESFSNVTLNNVSITEDLDALLGAGNYAITSAPSLMVDPGTLVLNGAYNGSGTPFILASASTLNLGATAQIRMVVQVTTVTDQGFGLGIYNNQVTATAISPDSTMTVDLSDNGTDPDPDGDGNPNEAGENDSTPIVLQGDIGDFVWNDLDGDGVQDGGEPGISGVTVFLDLNSNGMLDGGEPSDVTDASGLYLFTNLAAGNYTIRVLTSSVPSGFVLTGGVNPLNHTLFSGEVFSTADFGFQQQNASIGDFVWNDLDGDGVQDGGEPGLSGITVFIDLNSNGSLDGGEPNTNTNAMGAYDFTNLPIGTYTLEIDAGTVPSGFVAVTLHPIVVNLAAGEDYNNADFGYQQQDASIGDFVWNDLNGDGVQDGGEPGISGVTVFFDLNTNGVLDGGEPTMTSDGSGAYDFTNLPAGTYSVQLDPSTIPTGFGVTAGNGGITVNLAAGEDFNNADFGLQQQDATIGDFVWNDLNGDGVQNGGEPGLAGVTVFLDLNTNGMLDGGEPSATTDAAGSYDITNLATGTYSATIDGATVPLGFVLTGGNNPVSVTLASGEDYNDADFGYQQQDASIGDFVWNDLNGDGVQDPGEPGLASITVFLDLNTNGSLDGGEPSTITDGAGAYDFNNLPAGTYVATVDTTTLPTGFFLTTGLAAITVNLAAGEDYNSADFGYQQQNASIGDFVWNDLNGDGVQDVGEPGLVGIVVYFDLNSNDTLDGGEPSQTTDGSGAYDFTALPAGTYLVRIDASTVPSGFVAIAGSGGVNVNLAAGEDFNDADFGYQQQDASIGDFVWNDLNGDGIQDGGEPGLAGVTVFLDLNMNSTLDGGEPNATTDASGAYDLTNLPTGTFAVTVETATLPAGFVLTGGMNPLTVTIAAGEDFNSADFGYQQQNASIGDFVWNDLNGDGIQDGGEPGLAGITVFFDLNMNSSLDGGEPSTITNGSGGYDFTNLASGTYLPTIDSNSLPAGFVLTSGLSAITVNLAAGENFNDADFGYQQRNASIGDFVWNDLDGDGIQDGGEPGLAGVTVYLDLNLNGTLDGGEPSNPTDGAGTYQFSDLAAGTYRVLVDPTSLPPGFVLTTTNQPLDVVLTAGQLVTTADFGYQQQNASIGDFVWDDYNSDGIQDVGEPGLPGIVVFNDANMNGIPDGGELTTTTDGSGAYGFTNLPTGTYTIQIDPSSLPSGYMVTTGNLPLTINLAAGEVYTTADFGFCMGPTITQQPIGLTTCPFQPFTLTVAATGTPTLTYQWRRNGIDLPGETNTTLIIILTQDDIIATYSCLVSNGCGSVLSDEVVVTPIPILNGLSAVTGPTNTIYLDIDSNCDVIVDAYWIQSDGTTGLAKAGIHLIPGITTESVPFFPDARYFLDIPGGDIEALQDLYTQLQTVPTLDEWKLILFLSLLMATALGLLRKYRKFAKP